MPQPVGGYWDSVELGVSKRKRHQPPAESASQAVKISYAVVPYQRYKVWTDTVTTYDIQLTTAVMHGHIASLSDIFAIGKKLAHEVLQCKAAVLKNTSLAILCKYYIFGG